MAWGQNEVVVLLLRGAGGLWDPVALGGCSPQLCMATRSLWCKATRPPWHKATRRPCHYVSRPPWHRGTRSQRHQGTRLKEDRVTRAQSHQRTRTPGHKATSGPAQQGTRPQGHQTTRPPGDQATRAQGHQGSPGDFHPCLAMGQSSGCPCWTGNVGPDATNLHPSKMLQPRWATLMRSDRFGGPPRRGHPRAQFTEQGCKTRLWGHPKPWDPSLSHRAGPVGGGVHVHLMLCNGVGATLQPPGTPCHLSPRTQRA